jgi:uncharacterized protein (DUF1015 family)
MPEFTPFRGLRYVLERVSLEDVIAPPYDVVGPEERAALAARSPYNSILVELPLPEPVEGLDQYQNAACLLAAWEREAVLAVDDAESFYAYRMTPAGQAPGRAMTTGVIGAMAVDPEGSTVLPHEQTMRRDTRDRLELLRACHANLSPIWGLSLASGLSVAVRQAIARSSDHRSATDRNGTRHELWAISDRESILEIEALVGSQPLVIADGHHRYETAIRYREERRRANGNRPGGFDFVMTFVVELSSDELVVEPTHRVINGLREDFDLVGELSRRFRVEPAGDDPEALVRSMDDAGALGLVTPEGSFLLADDDPTGLDTARLDRALKDLPAHKLAYQQGASEAFASVRAGNAQAAILVKPTTVEQIAETARQRTTMPPKSTYFAPKPRTGMVFRQLDL